MTVDYKRIQSKKHIIHKLSQYSAVSNPSSRLNSTAYISQLSSTLLFATQRSECVGKSCALVEITLKRNNAWQRGEFLIYNLSFPPWYQYQWHYSLFGYKRVVTLHKILHVCAGAAWWGSFVYRRRRGVYQMYVSQPVQKWDARKTIIMRQKESERGANAFSSALIDSNQFSDKLFPLRRALSHDATDGHIHFH